MTALNFVGGATPDVTTSFTGFSKCYSNTAANGVALPTTGRADSLGNKPILVSTVQVYWAGKGGSRSLRIGIGSQYTGYFTIASDTSANASGFKTLNGIYLNGGNNVVTIDENGSSGFYFGRQTGSTGTTDPAGTNWGRLSGSVVYYQVPNSPTSLTVAQAALENAVNLSWTAPSDNGGTAVTSYSIIWSYNADFSGSTTISTGTTATTYKISGLTYGSTVYAKVGAVNATAAAAGSTSVASSSASGFITPPDLPLDGWANFGTVTNNTFTLLHTVIPALTPTTGFLRTGTSTVIGGTYTTGAVGMQKTYTNLTPGRQYIISGKAILRTAAVPANIYRFAVTGIGNGTSVTLTSTTVGATIPSYTFTASSATHTVEIELAETFTVSTVGVQESVGFYDYKLTRVATDLAYRVQDNLYTGTLVDHFDLATQSVGAYWWVDKNNVTQFAQDFDYALPVCAFSDTVADGNIYYNDIATSYDTANIINQITLNNIGSRRASGGSDLFEEYTVEWVDSDTTSRTNWGARQYDLTTNLWTEVSTTNLVANPHLAYSDIYVQKGSVNTTFARVSIADNSTGATGFMPVGTAAPVTGGGAFVARAINSANTPNTLITYGSDGPLTTTNDPTISVIPSTQYTAAVYLRAGVGHTASLTGRVNIYWYTNVGALISTTSGTASTIGSAAWTRVTLTATAPATAAFGLVAAWFIYGGANNTNFRYYSACAQMEKTSSAAAWFTGDTTDDLTYVYEWEGQAGASPSIRYNNIMDTRTAELLTDFANPAITVQSLRWNTAQNPIVATNLDIGSLTTVTFKGTTATYRVVGINHDITPDRWMMDLQVAKVT
jgi:hypothetical protein